MSDKKKHIDEVTMDSPIGSIHVNSPYGPRKGKMHHGVDLKAASGTPIRSPLNGVIIAKTSMDTGYHDNPCGGTIRVSHGDGIYTRYCHVKKIVNLQHGTPVNQGDIIGYTGGGENDPYRGRSTGAHLHFEMKQNGKLVDPIKFLKKEINLDYTVDDYKNDGFNEDDFSNLKFNNPNRTLSGDSNLVSDVISNIFGKMGSKKSSINTSKTNESYSDKMLFHLERKIPLHENVFRIESNNYFNLINEARELHREGKLDLSEDEIKLINTDIGKRVKTTLGEVYLDCPFVLDEAEYKGKKVELNKPRRTPSGPKKFAVYVMNPKTNKVKLVRFGDSNLSIKANDPEAKKSFLARHKCDTKKDRTKAGWWSCNIHLYKKQLGLKFKGKW